MKKQKSHRNSEILEISEIFIENCSSFTIGGDKDRINMHYYNYEVRKKRPKLKYTAITFSFTT